MIQSLSALHCNAPVIDTRPAFWISYIKHIKNIWPRRPDPFILSKQFFFDKHCQHTPPTARLNTSGETFQLADLLAPVGSRPRKLEPLSKIRPISRWAFRVTSVVKNTPYRVSVYISGYFRIRQFFDQNKYLRGEKLAYPFPYPYTRFGKFRVSVFFTTLRATSNSRHAFFLNFFLREKIDMFYLHFLRCIFLLKKQVPLWNFHTAIL